MLKVKFFTDEHIPLKVVEQLRKKGIEVIRCEDVGMKGKPDIVLLEYASENQCTLLSMDDDVVRLYYEWLVQGRDHYGIVYAAMAKFKGSAGIGPIVIFCTELAELIEGGAGSVEDDIKNELFRL